jgi:hypothetical protein
LVPSSESLPRSWPGPTPPLNHDHSHQFCATSLTGDQHSAQGLLEIIRSHWDACEIGAHYRRDVSLGEEACRVRQAAQPLTTLRNPVLGLYELKERRIGKPTASVPSWRRRMSASQALRFLRQPG